MELPERIGRYRIERLLGVGSFATVWLGHDETLDVRVAIKVLAENWSHDLRVRERFVDEARLLWRLEDPHLLRVHAFDELPDGRPYAVLAWADGGSLRDRLASGRPDVTSALRILHEVAAGVQRLHDERIVHRDLTPGNVLFRGRPDGEQAVVADLGLAKELAAASGLTARAGTPGYMAPEQDEPLSSVDTRTDVYSLGRLAAELLTDPAGTGPGRRPRPGAPYAVGHVVDRATARRPEDRYADASAFAAALTDAVRQTPGEPPHDVVRRPRWRRPAAIVLAGIVGLAAVVWWQASGAPLATTAEGRLTVALPDGWQGHGSGWSGRTGTDGTLEPALVVSPDPDAWGTDPAVPGAFVGLSAGLARETTPADYVAGRRHDHCDPPSTTRVEHDEITWVVATFDGCTSGSPQVVEAAGTAPSGTDLVYVQVATPAGSDPGLTDSLLAGVTVDP